MNAAVIQAIMTGSIVVEMQFLCRTCKHICGCRNADVNSLKESESSASQQLFR